MSEKDEVIFEGVVRSQAEAVSNHFLECVGLIDAPQNRGVLIEGVVGHKYLRTLVHSVSIL